MDYVSAVAKRGIYSTRGNDVPYCFYYSKDSAMKYIFASIAGFFFGAIAIEMSGGIDPTPSYVLMFGGAAITSALYSIRDRLDYVVWGLATLVKTSDNEEEPKEVERV